MVRLTTATDGAGTAGGATLSSAVSGVVEGEAGAGGDAVAADGGHQPAVGVGAGVVAQQVEAGERVGARPEGSGGLVDRLNDLGPRLGQHRHLEVVGPGPVVGTRSRRAGRRRRTAAVTGTGRVDDQMGLDVGSLARHRQGPVEGGVDRLAVLRRALRPRDVGRFEHGGVGGGAGETWRRPRRRIRRPGCSEWRRQPPPPACSEHGKGDASFLIDC